MTKKQLSKDSAYFLSRSAFLVLLTFMPQAFAQNVTPAAVTYQFAPVAQHSLQLTAAYWNPILDYVSTKAAFA